MAKLEGRARHLTCPAVRLAPRGPGQGRGPESSAPSALQSKTVSQARHHAALHGCLLHAHPASVHEGCSCHPASHCEGLSITHPASKAQTATERQICTFLVKGHEPGANRCGHPGREPA